MFDSLAAARENAIMMSRKYRCAWYVIKWSPDRFESVGPEDMYYGKFKDSVEVKA